MRRTNCYRSNCERNTARSLQMRLGNLQRTNLAGPAQLDSSHRIHRSPTKRMVRTRWLAALARSIAPRGT
jgi:hypothetical protein